MDDCWKLKNKEKRNGKSSNRNKSEEGDVLIAFASCVSIKDEWFLDSTRSYHLCINRDCFNA
jgi:hypothetical protein